MIPSSSRSERGPLAAVATALTCLACATQGAAFDSVTTLPAPARHPAGTDLDPATVLPAPVARGASPDGLIVLSAPADPSAARAVVAAFFRAVVDESPRALAGVLAEDAVMQTGSRREPAASAWAQRFARYDYRALAGETLYRDGDVRQWRDREDSMLTVRLDVNWGTRPRLFGDELTFRLVPSGPGYRVGEILEDFRSP